jgi:exonuclease SbcD
VIVRTTEPAVDLSDQVRELLPAATLLQVVEECSSRKLQALTRADAAATEELDFTTMFAEFLSQRGTRVGSADRVLKAFKTLVEAVGDEGPPTFAEETLLVDSTVDGGSTSPEALGAAS